MMPRCSLCLRNHCHVPKVDFDHKCYFFHQGPLGLPVAALRNTRNRHLPRILQRTQDFSHLGPLINSFPRLRRVKPYFFCQVSLTGKPCLNFLPCRCQQDLWLVMHPPRSTGSMLAWVRTFSGEGFGKESRVTNVPLARVPRE